MTAERSRLDLEEEVRRLTQEVADLRQALGRVCGPGDADDFGKLAAEQRTILNTVSLGIVYLKNRKIEWASTQGARLFGYEVEEVTGWDIATFYADPADYERIGREVYPRLALGTPVTFELAMKVRDGSRFLAQVTGQAEDPADLDKGVIFVTEDIGPRRDAERALRESEARFQRLLANSNDIICVVDDQGTATSIHGPLQRVLGYPIEEMVGRSVFELIHRDDLPAALETFRSGLRKDGALLRGEYRLRSKDGGWVTLEIVGAYLQGDPLVKGIVMNARDVSDRVRLQAQLQQAMKMEAIGRLAGGVAHDFNNVLTAILGNAELGRMKLAKSDPLRLRFEEIDKAAQSAAALTRQLLAFSRRQVIEPRVIDLNTLITNIQQMLRRLIGEDIRLQTVLEEDVGTVRVDPGQFEQVLVNLVVNARDAMPDGGVVTIETRRVELDEVYCARHAGVSPGERVLLSVTDSGQGMTEEVKEHLFEPFFTTKPKGRGTGLGLATTFGAVMQAEGSIEVYSEVGLGTSIKIYLPRLDARTEARVGAKSTPARARGRETVLLVEDDAAVREVVRAFLVFEGYSILEAAHGTEALAMAEQHRGRIALLLTDVVMPGMNGRELADRLRALQPEMKVLFTSGYTEDVVVHHGVLDHSLNFLGKPYSVEALARKIRGILDTADS